jgi:hypothetical protein
LLVEFGVRGIEIIVGSGYFHLGLRLVRLLLVVMSTSASASPTSAATTSKSSTLSRVSWLTSMLLTLTHALHLLRKIVHRIRCRGLTLSLTAILHVKLCHGLCHSSSS